MSAIKLGNRWTVFLMFFITRQTRNEKWFLLEQPADNQGTQYRNTIEFESLIYRWVKAKINRNLGDVISTIQLKIISPFFILCNDIKDVYFSFFWIYLILLFYFFFFCFSRNFTKYEWDERKATNILHKCWKVKVLHIIHFFCVS